MQKAHRDLFIAQLRERVAQSLDRTLNVCLQQQVEFQTASLFQLTENVFQIRFLLLRNIGFPLIFQTLLYQLSGSTFIVHYDEGFPGGRHVIKAGNFYWNSGSRFLNRLTMIIEHRSHPSTGCSNQEEISDTQYSSLDEHSSHRSLATADLGFDNGSTGWTIIEGF